MRDTTEVLRQLRKLMLQRNALAAYIIPSDDAHQSEYICPHDERRSFISGFDGSAGTAVVTAEKALLWTDGRYYQQAGQQLDSNWMLMKDGLPSTPSIGTYLGNMLPKGSLVGVDPKLISSRSWKPIQKQLQAAGCDLVPIEENLIDIVWGDAQSPPTCNPVKILGLHFSGETVAKKWTYIKQKMVEKDAEALIVSALDEIAWFLNLRGSDIEYNPVFFAYLIVTVDKIMLFIDSAKLPEYFSDFLKENDVSIQISTYDSIGTHLKESVEKWAKIWISPTSSYYLASLIPKNKRYSEITPIAIRKAIKNQTELKGFVDCHIRDGVALCQYFAWLESEIESGNHVSEISGATKLEEFRKKNDHFMGLSFATISSSGPNASVIHYHPSVETNRQIVKNEIYLCDSGAQYRDGTTDVTRTFHFGEPTDFQRTAYTLVLKGQLTLGSTIFPSNIKGQLLDTIARKSLWDVGLDYGHGTGHGVGHYLNVHEGPMGVGIRPMPDDPGLQENMILSNVKIPRGTALSQEEQRIISGMRESGRKIRENAEELNRHKNTIINFLKNLKPGYYKDGEFGIRIEDLVRIVRASSEFDFAGRGALTFETITMCPKQTKMIKKDLLSEKEIKILNDYHHQVKETIMPILTAKGDELTIKWLEKETRPI